MKFRFLYKNAKYLTLKDFLDNIILLILDIYTVFFWLGNFNAYLKACFHIWIIFFKFYYKNYTKT